MRDDEVEQMEEEELKINESAAAMAEQKVRFEAQSGPGLWDQSSNGRESMSDAVAWLREKLIS